MCHSRPLYKFRIFKRLINVKAIRKTNQYLSTLCGICIFAKNHAVTQNVRIMISHGVFGACVEFGDSVFIIIFHYIL